MVQLRICNPDPIWAFDAQAISGNDIFFKARRQLDTAISIMHQHGRVANEVGVLDFNFQVVQIDQQVAWRADFVNGHTLSVEALSSSPRRSLPAAIQSLRVTDQNKWLGVVVTVLPP
jgi:hypothetical protein